MAQAYKIQALQMLPASIDEYADFYDLLDGGDAGAGHPVNPVTGAPYEPQIVPRGDYTRVLAEFWADGPDSETPPGHWYVILNCVHDHPDFERRMEGAGPELEPLEWDVKAYFALGGTMHDAAITAWGIEGVVRLHPSVVCNSCDGGQGPEQRPVRSIIFS